MKRKRRRPKRFFPKPEHLYEWFRLRLGLPEGAFISRGFGRFPRLEFSYDERSWFDFSLPELVRVSRSYPISLSLLVRELPWGWFRWHGVDDERSIRSFLGGGYYYHFPVDGLALAQAVYWHHLELYGSAFVQAKGREFYFNLLQAAQADASYHELLEASTVWQRDGVLLPLNPRLQEDFPEIVRLHALYLRGASYGKRAILCGQDLREVSWPRGALRRADLRGVSLRNLNLDGEDLEGCDLRGADLTATHFVGANLENADLRYARLDLAVFKNANLHGAKMDDEKQSRGRNQLVDWDGCGIEGNLSFKSGWANLEFDWANLDLRGRCFSFASGFRPHLSGSNLEDACFRGATMRATNFEEANLRGADFSLFNCSHSRFTGADLTGANVWAACFYDARLDGATLNDLQNKDSAQWNDAAPANRDFRGGDFSNARLHSRNFAGCDFQSAKFNGAELCESNLEGANFRGADLREANFAGTNLSGADFRGAGYKGASFVGADLSGARYSRLKMRGAKR